MDNEISWELYRSYLSVLQEGSLSAAARKMGIAQPTVGRHIAALEKALGTVLFTRSQNGLLPTEAALDLQALAESMSNTAAALKRAAEGQGDGVRGTVRVTASEVIGMEVLPPILTQLQDAYPALKIELLLSNQIQDLVKREADIAIRMAQPKQEQLIARHIGKVSLGLYAHKKYLRKHGTPKSLAELAHYALIGFDEETPFIRAARKAFPFWQRNAFSFRSDSDVAQLAMIRAGSGIGICQVGIAGRDTQLVRLLADEFEMSLGTWLTMHEDLRRNPRCKATFDALLRGLQAYMKT